MEDERILRLRQTVGRGDFRKATVLWQEYAEWLTGEIRQGRAAEGQLQETRKLVDWSRQSALAARAHSQKRLWDLLTGLQAAEAYGRADSRPRAFVRASL